MEKRNRAVVMLVLPTIPNLIGAASDILKWIGKGEQLARKLRNIGKMICLPLCLASACIAMFSREDDEYQDSRIIALWLAFQTVLTFHVFQRSEEE